MTISSIKEDIKLKKYLNSKNSIINLIKNKR